MAINIDKHAVFTLYHFPSSGPTGKGEGDPDPFLNPATTKAITMTHNVLIVRSKVFSLRFATKGDGVILRGNYVIIAKWQMVSPFWMAKMKIYLSYYNVSQV